MFKLTDTELQSAYEVISEHGYSALFPPPPEWTTVMNNWPEVKQFLAGIDLDEYVPYKPLRIFVPKSRANLRVAHLLHPEDLIIYTALVIVVKDDLENARVSRRARRVFSYRTQPGVPNRLYETRGAYTKYLAELQRKSRKRAVRFVSIADIADFYPRVNQHRLENIITSTASNPRGNAVARVLMKKMISHLMEHNSYGIPVGPHASRVLGEAVLIDVDAHLESEGIDYVRWVDDYHIFSRTEHMAQSTVFQLAEWLFVNHGLTLQSAKTKIWPVARYVDAVLSKPEDRLTDRDTLLALFRDSGYVEEEVEGEELQQMVDQIHGFDLQQLFLESISDQELVDYRVVRYVLTRLPNIPGVDEDLRLGLLNIVVDNAELLYPVAEQIAEYVISFRNLSMAEKRRIGRKLARPLMRRQNPPPVHYAMWMLYVFSTSPGWINASEIVNLYSQSGSQVTKRYAALAISVCGTRAEALAIRGDLAAASSLLRLAILAASRKLGPDERRHWKRANPTRGVLEKCL